MAAGQRRQWQSAGASAAASSAGASAPPPHPTNDNALTDAEMLSQVELNAGAGAVSALWEGLEKNLLAYLLQTVEDPDALQTEESQWMSERDDALDAVAEEYAGGSAASLMISSENSKLLAERFEELLTKLS